MDSESFGERLKRLRHGLGLSKSELGRRAGVSRDYLYKLECGASSGNLTREKAEPLAAELHVSPSYLLYGSEKYPPLSEANRVPVVKHAVIAGIQAHAGEDGGMEVEYAYREPCAEAEENIEGYKVVGTCLEPDVKEGDTIIVDREKAIRHGDLVAYQVGGALHVGKIKKIGDKDYLINNDGTPKSIEECQAMALIVYVIRKCRRGKE